MLAAVATAVPAGATPLVVESSGPLVDLQPNVANPTDGAEAHVIATAIGDGTTRFVFVVTGLDPDSAGMKFGAHVHTGSCVAGDGAAAGPHYNSGGPADPEHEVWLDFRVRPGGVGISRTTVPFEIPDGAAHTIVIHAMATQPGGAAGARQACLPVDF